jgi:hypothetical protein
MRAAAHFDAPPPAHRRVAARVLAALALVCAFLGTPRASSAAVGLHASLTASTAQVSTASPEARDEARREEQARLSARDAEEQADLPSRSPVPAPLLRPRSLAGWDGKLLPSHGLPPIALSLPPLAAAALDFEIERDRIAELLERALRPCDPREPNPARGPPRRALRRP